MVSVSGIEVRFGRIAVVIVAVIVAVVVYRRYQLTANKSPLTTDKKREDSAAGHITIKDTDVSYVRLPGKGGANKNNTVLLLHGMKFGIKDWEDIDTLTTIASWGFDVVAVGLSAYTGYGKVSWKEANAAFMAELVAQLDLVKPVIVAPSASGSLALPYLFESGADTAGDRMRAFIAIAPSTTTIYAAEQYKALKIPVLNLHGEKDSGANAAAELMKNVPDVTDHVFAGASHPCYLEQPGEWHDVLKKFLTEKVHWSATNAVSNDGTS